MYYATKRNTAQTRAIGLATSVAVLAGTAVAVANGFGNIVQKPPAETEVVLIEEVEEIEDEPPPPPPVDIDLPPPPPQVILPDFVFESPPPENVFKDLAVVKEPVKQQPPPAKTEAKPAPVLPPVRPRADPQRMGEQLAKDYPQSALRRKQEGEVGLAMCMSADGRASNVRVINSSGVPALDEQATKSVTRLKFSPAKDSAGKAVAWCPPTYPEYTMTLVWKVPE
jgi:protein TonB